MIKPEIVPGRMGLLVTIFLVLINIFNGAQINAPVTALLNAIDIYILGCIGHVFLVLSEYVIVLTRDKYPGPCKRMSISSRQSNKHTTAWPDEGFPKHKLDSVSVILFPIIFIIFNLVYWIMFYYWISGSGDGVEFMIVYVYILLLFC